MDGDFTFDCEHSTPTGLPTRTGSQAGVNSRIRFLATQTNAISFLQLSKVSKVRGNISKSWVFSTRSSDISMWIGLKEHCNEISLSDPLKIPLKMM